MLTISKRLRFPANLFFHAVDERIYALMRIAFSAVALLSLICLWPDRLVFFSDAGLVNSAAAVKEARPFYFSIFALGQSEAVVTSIMLVSAFALVMLMLGIGSRIATFWVFIWHVSYMARSPLPLAGWDLVLRCFSFLLLVSPLGKCWSLPTIWRGRAKTAPTRVPAYGLILIRLQVLVIYWQAVLARWLHPDPYWKNGEFLSYFLLSHHSRWAGPWVLKYGGLLALGTYAIQLSEFSLPVLLMMKKTRWWGILLGICLHAGISVCTQDIGLFGLSMVMAYTAFLRKEDMDSLERLLKFRHKSEATANAALP